MWEQNLLHESNYHSQTEVTEIAEAESSPLDELDFVVNTFHHATGDSVEKLIGSYRAKCYSHYNVNLLHSL